MSWSFVQSNGKGATSAEHISHAVAYAVKAHFLGN